MRLRLFLLTLLGATLMLSTPYVALTDSSDYHASAASLRQLWATDLANGVSPSSLAPLEQELDSQTQASFLGVPTLALNPLAAQTEFDSLHSRTNLAYQSALTSSRSQALAARTTLQVALGPSNALAAQPTWRELLNTSITPKDYLTLAAAWQLDALLIPLDRSLAEKLSALQTLAATWQVSDYAANRLITTTTNYFDLDASARYQAAPNLLATYPTALADLQTAIDIEVARRGALTAEAARLAVQASASLHLTLNGYYSDCRGTTVLSDGLYLDTCITSTTYLVSHKWSTGRFFFNLHVGSQLNYQGRLYTVYSIYTATPDQEVSRLNSDRAALTLQTCYTDSGSILLMILAR